MALARQAATFAKGRSQEAFQGAAEGAAGGLAATRPAARRPALRQHRAAGRPIVLATTTPYDIVKPFADLLGLDDVVATRYGVDADGKYDGRIVGNFVWSTGKLAAVREWATRTATTSRDSFAYSDSCVRHAAARRRRPSVRRQPRPADAADGAGTTAADPQSRRLAGGSVKIADRRDRAAEAGPAVHPGPSSDALRQVRHPGAEHIPKTVAAIIVANHRSYFDSGGDGRRDRQERVARCASSARRRSSTCRSSASSRRPLGGIRVDRATGSDAPLEAAAEALADGEMVAIMPQGTIPRGPAFFEPESEGSVGRGPPGPLTRLRSSRSDVGDREGLAAVDAGCRPCSTSPTRRPCGSASATPVAAQATDARRRHEADHGRDRPAAPGRGSAAADSVRRGAGRHLSAGLQGRPDGGIRTTAGYGLNRCP